MNPDFKFPDFAIKPVVAIEDMTLNESLELEQFVKWSDLKHKMNEVLREKGAPEIQTYHLQRVIGEDMANLEAQGGLKKAGGTWLVVPKLISRYFKRLIDRVEIESISEKVSDANDLIKLNGVFRWNDMARDFPPFTHYARYLPHYLETNYEDVTQLRATCGIWFSETDRAWLVDMQVFVPFFFENLWERAVD